MPKIRIIPKLEIKGLNVIKGIRMEGLRVVGLPEEMSLKYYLDSADEILFIDTVASLYGRNNLHDLVSKVSDKIRLPLCVGGGIRNLEEGKALLRSGADKVSINTQACKTPDLITSLAKSFGSQSVVASIQAKKKTNNMWEAYYNNGREKTDIDVIEWVKEVVDRGAGELLLTSIDQDGTKLGPDLELVDKIINLVNIPVIVSGGINSIDDILKLIDLGVSALAIANILHFNKATISGLKKELIKNNFSTRLVNFNQ
jgi:imidazole glycerol-phosphate synthase subunit HisF